MSPNNSRMGNMKLKNKLDGPLRIYSNFKSCLPVLIHRFRPIQDAHKVKIAIFGKNGPLNGPGDPW